MPIAGVELVAMDVRDEAAVNRAIRDIVAKAARIDVLINNAGVSVLGFLPAPYMGVHVASKQAVEGLSESLDHEVRPFGIRVMVVDAIVAAATGPWRMRHTPKGTASLLSKLRRFMPFWAVDASLRESFGLR
jgi:short-subunit dehydrogenase